MVSGAADTGCHRAGIISAGGRAGDVYKRQELFLEKAEVLFGKTPKALNKQDVYRILVSMVPVSYTHLDVYKRQEEGGNPVN